MKDHIDLLEAEAVYILREVAGQFKRPVLLFSGGKDSTVLIHLARKAFYPGKIPFPVLHIDTGHNFEEVLLFRDQLVEKYNLQLIVSKVEDTIREKKLKEVEGKFQSRNVMQSITLKDTISSYCIDACIGGGRRDEEKARAKERIFSFRGIDGAWAPYKQGPEIWGLYNGRIREGENIRVFPISNWSELDVWYYVKREGIELAPLYYSHERQCLQFNNKLMAVSKYVRLDESDLITTKKVRYRTVGDMTCTAATESIASTIDEVIMELTASTTSERGETRIDDQFSEAAMEDRKTQGYF